VKQAYGNPKNGVGLILIWNALESNISIFPLLQKNFPNCADYDILREISS
jgi:hypothetical protein